VPIKSFTAAKRRLDGVLDEVQRAELARTMAAHVLECVEPLPAAVACDDPEVARFAEARGALVVWTPGLGLNGAVAAGVDELSARGASHVTIVHADLAVAVDVGSLEAFDGVTIAPDRRRTGTNLLRVPTPMPIEPSFGRDSFRRHVAACELLGVPTWILERDDLALDIDEPDDLRALETRNGGTP
jgi:2-phospho-L-lactate guanylyltransferase